ncbi:MAG: ATP-binding protein [Chloroflexota bacterium]
MLRDNLLVQFAVFSFLILLALAVGVSALFSTDQFSIQTNSQDARNMAWLRYGALGASFLVLYGGLVSIVWSGWRTIQRQQGVLTKTNETLWKANEDLKAAHAQSIESAKLAAVGQLVSGVAHELNNPLASMWGLAQLTMERNLDEPTKGEVEMILTEAERSLRIVQNLLSFARPSERLKVDTSVNAVVKDALELRRYALEVSNIKLVEHLHPDLPLTYADPHGIQQVVLNLIINAEQAMLAAHGGGRLLVRTEQVGHMIHLEITDNGPGIPPENLAVIFDPFFTTKDVGKGTGLGLSICYGTIQQHGGRIRVQSELDKGATFIVELPIVPAITTAQPEIEAESQKHADRLVTMPTKA